MKTYEPTCPHCGKEEPDWIDIVGRDYYAPAHAENGESHEFECSACRGRYKFTAIVTEMFINEPMPKS